MAVWLSNPEDTESSAQRFDGIIANLTGLFAALTIAMFFTDALAHQEPGYLFWFCALGFIVCFLVGIDMVKQAVIALVIGFALMLLFTSHGFHI
jgi:hypothetical protein